MIKIDTRESAHVKSRVKDLSVVPNVINYTGLFAAITPISKTQPVDEVYEPVLCRDVDTLISNFGDPRIDPEKYIDLYNIMQIINNGTSCYVVKVHSGTSGVYRFNDSAFKDSSIELNPVGSTNTKYDCVTDHKIEIDDITINASEVIHGDRFTYETEPVEHSIIKVTFKNSQSGSVTAVIGSESIPLSVVAGSNNKEFESAEQDRVYTSVDHIEVDSVETQEDHDLEIRLLDKFRTIVTFDTPVTSAAITSGLSNTSLGLMAYSSLNSELLLKFKLIQAKPYSLNAYYLDVKAIETTTNTAQQTIETNLLKSVKVKLEDQTTNQALVNALNSYMSGYLQFDLVDPSTANACKLSNDHENSIVANILKHVLSEEDRALELAPCYTVFEPEFEVTCNNYIDAIKVYKDKKYAGCMLADLTAPVANDGKLESLSYEDRRSLHYYLKEVAAERKDCTVVLSTPNLELNDACDWVSSQGSYSDEWEYGTTNTTAYSEQSFYLEMYYSWLKLNCIKLQESGTKSVQVLMAPAGAVAKNILASFRERGTQYPVAGDQQGILGNEYIVVHNPKTKAERDQLVQYRINPIWDTGTRGVQIFGNETLNAGYTDLNAAHIARTLVNIRSRVDEYTETLKFSLNNIILWDTWKNYVTSKILEPLASSNALASFTVAMGPDTTSPEEIANRMIRGKISLVFYQSAEIFDLEFTVLPSTEAFE